ncbi:uncharacterized protein B0H18DRAFT_967922 [Fomitopsis serialis]|uniref:uncharacterized protein n=1 Tax=Fomitopsis serialis TaxID=139415 RepID=UPI0020073511|nr:uncharacterized protein B0H18DRAFT_967922 [Neoantrodia serialis]KAH9938595.1 hypothetical protein B0H18DRAFT_967922 [Neoantrodia serialis]
MPPPTQAFGESALARNPRIHEEPIQPIAFAPTQLFAPSRLATIISATTTAEAPGDEDEFSPSMQVFAPSRLATGLGSTRALDTANKSPPPTRKRSFSKISADGPFAY